MSAPSSLDVACIGLNALIDKWRKNIDIIQRSGGLSEMCMHFLRLDEEYTEIDNLRKELYKLLDGLDKTILPELFEKAGVDKIAVPEVERSFYLVPKYSASILDKEAGYQWLRDNGMESMIGETVNAGTLAAYLRARLIDEGLDPPDSMKLNSYKTIGSSKYKPKPTGKK